MVNNKLRLIIITQGVSRILMPIVSQYNVVGIIESQIRKTEHGKSLLFNIARKVYVTLNIKKKTLKSFSSRNKIPFYYMNNGSDSNLEKWVKNKKPDIIIVYSMSQLLRRNIFDIPTYGTLNLHPSILPKYRGPNPWFWMYYNMEKKGGVTLHFIDDCEDTGDIVYQEEFEIPLGIKSSELQDLAIGQIGVGLILKALKNINNLPKLKQPKTSPTKRARNIKNDEHKILINWTEFNVEKIWHILRGTEMWFEAIETPKNIFKGNKLIIEHYEKCNMTGFKIGRINKEKNQYFVACKDGRIYLTLKFNFKKLIMSLLSFKPSNVNKKNQVNIL